LLGDVNNFEKLLGKDKEAAPPKRVRGEFALSSWEKKKASSLGAVSGIRKTDCGGAI